ncbi:MAG: SCP2 sterol-binding domain-containing protein [Rhodanobacteraceae bacterium]
MEASSLNAWLPRPLRRLAERTLEAAFNRVLRFDPDTRSSLVPLEGRRIGVHLRGPEIGFDIVVREGALRIEPPQSDEDTAAVKPDLRVVATPGALLTMAIPRAEETLPPGKVEIAGDAELARRVEKLARDFAPDVEAAFARTFGEVLGVPIARALRDATHWLRESADHAATDSVDWLRDDARLVIPRGEMDDFLDGVDALRERAERLSARVGRLSSERT